MANKAKVLLALLLCLGIMLPFAPIFAETGNAATDLTIVRDDPSSLNWNSSEVAYIDFSEIDNISLSDGAKGHGLDLLPNNGATSWNASNRLDGEGNLLLGKDAYTNGGNPETFGIGHIYLKLDASKAQKANKPYAVKLEYYAGGGIAVDAGSYVDLYYNLSTGKEASSRITYGSTFDSGKVETKYYAIPLANFSEGIGTPKGDIRLTTWNNAQLKIRRVSVVEYEPINMPPMTEVIKSVTGEPASSVDFGTVTNPSMNGSIAGDGLTVLTNIDNGSQRAANRFSDGYMLLGKAARFNTLTGTGVNQGRIYVKLNETKANKANKAYAVKVDYLAQAATLTVADTTLGIAAEKNTVDANSWITIVYTDTAGTKTKETARGIFGANVNSGEVKSMYFLLPDANLSENVDDNGQNKGADFKLNTVTSDAQLKIKGISVVAYDKTQSVTNAEALFSAGSGDDVPDGTVFINPNTGKFYGLTYSSGTPVVKIIDKQGEEHFAAQSVDYLNFKISDPAVKAAKQVTLSISYWDIGKRSFSVQYNAQIPDPLPDNTGENYYNYFSTPSFEMYDTKELVTINIPLESCAFNGKQNGANDFRFYTMYIPDFYVESVSVKIGVEDVTLREPVEFPAQTAINDFADRTIVGYQAWFQASESQTGGWNHWNSGAVPAGGRQTFDIYPDVSDYPDSILYQTGYSDLLNGEPAVLYDGTTEEAIDTQVKWMKDYGIDGFAVSRFYSGTSAVEIKVRTKLDYMKEAAEKYGRLFYMGYDMSGIGGNGEAGIKRLQADFVLNVEQKFVTSPNYAQIDGKPVVSLWGFQGSQFNRYPTTQNSMTLINWFHERGYYVIGGCPDNNWAQDTTDYSTVYEAIDMITPWTVGRYNNTNAEAYLEQKYKQDRAWLDDFNAKNPDNQKSYMPTIYPGFSWANWASGSPNAVPRNAGEFMWDQAKLAKKYGFTSSFIAMFDEYDEGTSIAKMAEDSMSIPSDQYFVTAAADGKWLSSDFYLRATGAITKLLCGEIQLTDTIPIPHATGPVFWRNGFERRFVNFTANNGKKSTALANLDVCIPNGEILTDIGISDIDTIDIIEDPYGDGFTSTGEYSFNMSGTGTPVDGKSQFYFKIADTNIEVKQDMILTYNLRTETEHGGYVFVDLLLDNGQKLSDIYGGTVKAHRGTVGSWTPVTFSLSSALVGRRIDSVIIAYDSDTAGEFNAYIDDVVIQNANMTTNELNKVINDASALIAGDYAQNFTTGSVSNLQAMIAKAKAVLADANATESAIKDAYFSLLNAMNSLVAVKRAPVVDPGTNKPAENMSNNNQNNNSVNEPDNTANEDTGNEKDDKPTKKPTGNTKPNSSDDVDESSSIPWILIGIAGGGTLLALAAMVVFALLKRRKEASSGK